MKGIRDIPNNDAHPQLSRALDASVMLEKLQTILFETAEAQVRFSLIDCEVVYLHYKPYKPCTVCYQILIRDTKTNQQYSQLYSARIFGAGDSQIRYDNSKRSFLLPPPWGKPLLHIPEFEMVLWSFPNDRKLTILPQLIDPILFQDHLLPDILVRVGAQDWIHQGTTLDVMNYVPRYSCTVRVILQLQHLQSEETKTITIYGKTYSNHTRGERGFLIMQALWATTERISGKFRMAEPLWYDPTHNIFWQYSVPGVTLLQIDMAERPFSTLLGKAGEAIAVLHSLPVSDAQPMKIGERISGLQKINTSASHLQPQANQLFEHILAILIDQGHGLGEQAETTLHGDLHFKNFIVDGTAVSLIDLDEVGRGSPYHDLGSFLSFLFYQGLEVGIEEPRIEELVKMFIHGYQQHVPWEVCEPMLRWYVATALITERMVRCLKKGKPGANKQIERLLTLTYQLVTGNRTILPVPETRFPIPLDFLPTHPLILAK